MTSNNSIDTFKLQAARLRSFLKQSGVNLKHTNALEAVAQMHGSSNFHTLRASTTLTNDTGENEFTNCHRFMTDALNRVLEQRVAICDTVEVVKRAFAMEQILQAGEKDGSIYDEHQFVAVLSAILAVNPNHVSAMLKSVPSIMPDGHIEDGCYSSNENLYERIIERCKSIWTTELSDVIDNEERYEIGMMIRPFETIFYCHHALALGAFERGDYRRMAVHLEQAAWAGHDFERELELPPSARLAAAAWMVVGDFESAQRVFQTDHPKDPDGLDALLRCFSAVACNKSPDAADEKVITDNGLIHEVLATMELTSVDPDYGFSFSNPDTEDNRAPILDVLDVYFLKAVAAGCAIRPAMAQWVRDVAFHHSQRQHLH